MGKYEIMFYNALMSIGPAILIAWATGDLHKVRIVTSHSCRHELRSDLRPSSRLLAIFTSFRHLPANANVISSIAHALAVYKLSRSVLFSQNFYQLPPMNVNNIASTSGLHATCKFTFSFCLIKSVASDAPIQVHFSIEINIAP